jgi:CRISPR system Cascade subunit CasC
MSRFLQLHLLTFYPPSNLNRDDTGRPKTAVIGGTTRLRLSSQALKRAWRTSDAFEAALAGHLASRTQRFGEIVHDHLIARGMEAAKAQATAIRIGAVFGKPEEDAKKNPLYIRQLAFISPDEQRRALELADLALAGETIAPSAETVLQHSDSAVDLAMFGRMLADHAEFNRDAAVQVAHAFTTHAVPVEDDFYTAVDDLKKPSEDTGAGFIGEAGFGSGVFYLYLCVDRVKLTANLGGNAALAQAGIAALITACATVAPSGKQNSFAALARAHYILAESGDAQPRTLAGAFAKSAGATDPIAESARSLKAWRAQLDDAYGDAPATCEMQVGEKGTLSDIIAFARG